MKYYKLYTLTVGSQAFIKAVKPGDVGRIRNAVWYCNQKKKWKIKSTEQYVDANGKTETETGYNKNTRELGVIVYRIS